MRLSLNFTLEELTRSDAAIRHGIVNKPTNTQVGKLAELCRNVLQKIRDKVNDKINVNSGFRVKRLNRKLGGAKRSQHMLAEAADITAPSCSAAVLYHIIKKMVATGEIEVDQCILEFGSWVHVSFREGKNRNEFLIASKVKDRWLRKPKVVYAKNNS